MRLKDFWADRKPYFCSIFTMCMVFFISWRFLLSSFLLLHNRINTFKGLVAEFYYFFIEMCKFLHLIKEKTACTLYPSYNFVTLLPAVTWFLVTDFEIISI